MTEKRMIIIFAISFVLGVALGMLFASKVEAYEYAPEEIVQIGKIVEHECPHESELGKRLVVDTILNRVESDKFPNSVKEVLEQPGQYCKPTKYPPTEIYKIVADEIYMRTNNQVLWYRTNRYHGFGVPLVKEGNHYFSGGM